MITTSSSPAFRGHAPILVLLLAAAGTAACERPPAGGRPAVAQRLIEEPTDEVFDLQALRRSYGYQRQVFNHKDQLRRWRLHGNARRVIEGAVMKLRPSGEGKAFINLVHEIDLVAEDVREIAIAARGIARGRLRLSWAIPGEGFSSRRQIWLRAGGGGQVVYRFAVEDHAEWRGRIHTLRLDLPNVAGQEIDLRWFETRGREDYEAEMLARAVDQDWKVELGYEARNAVLAPPDVPRRWRLSGVAGGRKLVLRLEKVRQCRAHVSITGSGRVARIGRDAAGL